MANYAYVEDNNIVGVYDLLPTVWRNYSNFFALEGEWDYLKSLGWYKIEHVIPEYDPITQKIDNPRQWFENDTVYQTMDIIDIPQEPTIAPEIQIEQITHEQWDAIRTQRDRLMSEFEWRYTRYNRQIRSGITPTDDILVMDTYMQALADITQQENPFNIIWPEEMIQS